MQLHSQAICFALLLNIYVYDLCVAVCAQTAYEYCSRADTAVVQQLVITTLYRQQLQHVCLELQVVAVLQTVLPLLSVPCSCEARSSSSCRHSWPKKRSINRSLKKPKLNLALSTRACTLCRRSSKTWPLWSVSSRSR